LGVLIKIIESCNKSTHNQQEEERAESWRAPNINQPSASLHYERPETARYISNAVRAKSNNRPPYPPQRRGNMI